ncbi:hypothetical protein GCM10007857_76890 [Bradyrhizobium iriomotense]|uniref:Phosphonate metabolism protein/1,5-bisphosphokinase (PRPP-forming) PhnN n=1 Tax=Bradyrhizobium iriomotense TaxID=441950 RepID=A0ABQ6BAA1_9BRAD|nr:hypothetical protein GCM10007857_76890 [Bradyrhizobium iriomotense]
MTSARGHLVLVVGPSVAGKDTLIDFARAQLQSDPDFHFARRVITVVHHSDFDSLEVAG